jgi:hypothetical protein
MNVRRLVVCVALPTLLVTGCGEGAQRAANSAGNTVGSATNAVGNTLGSTTNALGNTARNATK